MAPEATKAAGKAGTPQKDDAPEVKGPLSALTDRERDIVLQCILTVKGFPGPQMGIDTQAAADRLGFTNTRSLTNTWGNIKKKLAEWEKKDHAARGLPSEDEAAAEQADSAADDGDAAAAKPTPKKRARTGTTKSAGAGTPRAARGGGGRASANSTPRKKAAGNKNTPTKSPAGKNASLLDYFSPSSGASPAVAKDATKDKEEDGDKVVGGGKADADDDMFVSGDV